MKKMNKVNILFAVLLVISLCAGERETDENYSYDNYSSSYKYNNYSSDDYDYDYDYYKYHDESSSSSSSSSDSNKYNYDYSTDSYDKGYEDVYENEDWDDDRYEYDEDYADGVDEALDELGW